MNGRFWLILLLLILWFLLGGYFFNKYLCGTKADPTPAVLPIADKCADWTIKDGNSFNKDVGTYYKFKRSSFTPVNTGIEFNNAIDATADYLKSNGDRVLLITGLYDTLESNMSILGDIGMARANAIKKAFVAKNVSSKQINIASQINNRSCYKGDTLRKGALFSFGALTAGSDRIESIKKRLSGKPITLYFGTNQDNISLSRQQRTDFTDLLYYLDNVDGSSLSISGHTDIIGNRNSNIELSLSRADFVKGYLKKNGGISESKMNTQGFGPDKPVASNKNEKGRALNRRVEVTLN